MDYRWKPVSRSPEGPKPDSVLKATADSNGAAVADASDAVSRVTVAGGLNSVSVSYSEVIS